MSKAHIKDVQEPAVTVPCQTSHVSEYDHLATAAAETVAWAFSTQEKPTDPVPMRDWWKSRFLEKLAELGVPHDRADRREKFANALADTVDTAFAYHNPGDQIPAPEWWRVRFTEAIECREREMLEEESEQTRLVLKI